jgi:hypothetical protein
MTASGNGQLEAVNMKALLISVGQQPESKCKVQRCKYKERQMLRLVIKLSKSGVVWALVIQ